MTTYTQRTILGTAPAAIVRVFPFNDRLGRQIGAQVTVRHEEFTVVEGASGGYRREPGRYWSFTPSATRDGRPYGASQNPNYFNTQTEMDKAISTYFAKAEKRAAKVKGAVAR